MTQFAKTLVATTAAAMLGISAAAVPALAEQTRPGTQGAAPGATQGATQVDDATLKAFAEASLEVEEVIEKWQPRMDGADEAEAQQIRRDANREMVEAVQSNGLNVETYTQLAQLTRTDPELAAKVQRYRQDEQ